MLNTLSRASLSRASRQLVHLNNHVRPSSSSSVLAAVGFPTSSSTKTTTTRQQSPAAPAIRFFSTTSSKEDALHLAQSQATPEAAVQKGFFGKIADRLSIKGQQRRIILGEELFQAAFRQSNDPYVMPLFFILYLLFSSRFMYIYILQCLDLRFAAPWRDGFSRSIKHLVAISLLTVSR